MNNATAKIPYSHQTVPLYNELKPLVVYFIDGKCRVACICSLMLHAMSRGADMSYLLFGMHDWVREWYRVVLEVGDIVHELKCLVVSRTRLNMTITNLSKI